MKNHTLKAVLKDHELIGTATITASGNFKADCQRFGSETGDKRRGGTWYEIPAYEGAKSSYELSERSKYGCWWKAEVRKGYYPEKTLHGRLGWLW